MHTPSDALNAVNRLIHEPVRLAILTSLSACEDGEYLYLQRLTGASGGNLAGHVRRLAEGGLVEIHKGYAGNMPETRASITPKGRQAIEAYWKQIEVLRDTFSDRDFIERWRTRERLA